MEGSIEKHEQWPLMREHIKQLGYFHWGGWGGESYLCLVIMNENSSNFSRANPKHGRRNKTHIDNMSKWELEKTTREVHALHTNDGLHITNPCDEGDFFTSVRSSTWFD